MGGRAEDPQQRYVSEVLPFGASAEVFGFNRYAWALRKIGTRLFSIVWTNFFDDFPQIDLGCMGNASMGAAERLLELLGWRFSKKPEKRLPFERSFDVFGVVVDLSASDSGKVVVRNKLDRVEAIAAQVDDMVAEGVCKPSAAASLRGRFQFAEGQLYGRAVAVCTPAFRRRALGYDNAASLHDDVIAELRCVWNSCERRLLAHCRRRMFASRSWFSPMPRWKTKIRTRR